MDVRNVQNRLDKFLEYGGPLQQNVDYRLKIFFYNIGDVVKHDVYDIYYGKKNPIKHSLKSFIADMIIQGLLYARSKGFDLDEIIALGLDRITSKVYEEKGK